MSSRATVFAGLLSGALFAAALLAAVIALGPARSPGSSRAPLLPSGAPGTSPAATSAASGPLASGAPASGAAASGDLDGGTFHVGRQAPPLSVPQVGGGTVDLRSLRGQPVWVNFMATWCPSCLDEFPRMNSFAARYADEGLVVLAIDVKEDEGTAASFAQRLNATFPMGLDTDGRAQDAWGAYALPVHYWIDSEGIVRFGALGGIGPDVMVTGLELIMPGVEVTP